MTDGVGEAELHERSGDPAAAIQGVDDRPAQLVDLPALGVEAGEQRLDESGRDGGERLLRWA